MKTRFCAGLQCRASALIIVLLLSAFAVAQVKPQITQAVNPTMRSVLGRTVSPMANAANDRGRAESNLPMKSMMLMLRPSGQQTAALKRFLDDQHNPNSPNYHKWLTPEQYAAQFGAADADVKTVSAWLVSNGFSIDQVAHGKDWIRFSGTAAQVEQAFQTQIHQYSIAGATKYANATNLSIPTALVPAVAGLVSVNNFVSSPQHIDQGRIARDQSGKLVRMTSSGTLTPAPTFTDPGQQEGIYLTPGDFSKIYDSEQLVSSGVDGSGVSIAIVGRSDISLSDVEAFRTVFGLPAKDPNVIYASTDPGVVPGDDEEAVLDVEWSGAVAPQATINYVIGATTSSTDGAAISASYIVDNVVSPIMSMSFGMCEANMSDTQVEFYHMLWQQAAAEGITVLVSSGDSGASGCNVPSAAYTTTGFGVNGLASTPYNVAVGGTEFNEPDVNSFWNLQNGANQSSVKGYVPEAVWNESCNGSLIPSLTNCHFAPYYIETSGGGGGASSCAHRTIDDSGNSTCVSGYSKPTWQIGPGVPQDSVRDLPDVSLDAAAEHDGYMLCYNGSCQWTTNKDGSILLQSATLIGGTSASSPAMAGIMALVEQQHGQFQGVANYELYKLAAAEATSGNCGSSQRTDPTKPTGCVFNDITDGSNAVPCRSGSPNCTTAGPAAGSTSPQIVLPATVRLLDGYSATAGYDQASGLGSVDIANLINAWGTTETLPSTTSMSLSQTSFKHGTSVTVTAQVAPASGNGTPSGEVLLQASTAGAVQSGELTNGSFTGSTIDLPGGTYNLTAQYSGDATYSSSTSAPVSVTVTPEDSTLTGTTYAYSPFYVLGKRPLVQLSAARLGEPFWIQVQVAGASGSTKATGTVKLSYGDNKVIGTYPVNKDGLISVQCGPSTECDLGVGSYTFTAEYSGDASFNPSTTTIPFTVNKGLIYWAVFLNTQTPPPGGQVVATVEFTNDPTVMPTGTVTLTRDDTGETLGSGTIDKNGTVVITFAAPEGSYFVAGAYSGDDNYIAVNQEIGQQIITNGGSGTAATNTTLSTAITNTSLGQRTQINVAVAPVKANNATPIGTVTLYSANTQISPALILTGGKASSFVEWDYVGVQHVYAIYSGDRNFASSNSSNVAVTVAPATPTLGLTATTSYVLPNSQASITAAISSAVSSASIPMPTGSVQFYDSVNGGTVQPIGTAQAINIGNGEVPVATLAPLLAAGTHSITAQYLGDPNWHGATSGAVQIVATSPDFTVAPTAKQLTVVAGQTASINVSTGSILGFNGTIALSCGGTLPEGFSCNTTTVAPGGTGTLTLTTTAPGTTTQTAMMHHRDGLWQAAGIASFAMMGLFWLPRRRRFHGVIIALLACSITGMMVGCGGNSSGPVAPSAIILTSSNAKVASGTSVTFQASVSSTKKLTGLVTFYDGTTVVGAAIPVNGLASVSTTSLSVGTHTITAKYAGDKDTSAANSSNAVQQTITGNFTLVVNATSGNVTHPMSIPATLQ